MFDRATADQIGLPYARTGADDIRYILISTGTGYFVGLFAGGTFSILGKIDDALSSAAQCYTRRAASELGPEAVALENAVNAEMAKGNIPKLADDALTPAVNEALVVHQDQVIMNTYQRYYNEAWEQAVQRFNAGEITIQAGQNWRTVLGQYTDAVARTRLRIFLARERIPEGPGASVLVNRWLRDPSGSGAYRIPDLRLQQTQTILDGTIGTKTPATPQIQDFGTFSGGFRVIIVRPTVKPTP